MFQSLKKKLSLCQTKDTYNFSKKIRALETSRLTTSSPQAKALEIEVNKSIGLVALRDKKIPKNICYPPALPVSKKSNEIKKVLLSNQVVVVTGDTGSGKTTQLPKICLEAGLGRKGLIAHSQPRRLAATSVAKRIAEELNSELGDLVGFKIRFNDRVKTTSCIKLMTDGILLSEIQGDRYLSQYDAVIIDEAHERSLNIDFLMGFLKKLVRKRDDLKVIITSATIDVEKISQHFDNAPIISVEGRSYPVETRYCPVVGKEDDKESNLLSEIIKNLHLICQDDIRKNRISGDILVFLSSEREIREAALAIRKSEIKDTEILPLYARLRPTEQVRIFRKHSGRRVILSTNVAETSLTVPGIRYVIDSGFARISRYNLLTKIQRLPIEPISKASADQRKGRCGRIANGVCIRIYSEEDFNSRPSFTDPEIRRTNLAAVILRMLALRLGDVDKFPFLEPPEDKSVNEGFKLLIELKALTTKGELTTAGKQMARLPVDPKMARMLIVADKFSCLKEVLIIVSMLSIQDPRETLGSSFDITDSDSDDPSAKNSDFTSFVEIWNNYESKRLSYSQSQLKKLCKEKHLSFVRMREWREVHKQLVLGCRNLGFKENKESGSYAGIHKSIIAGSLNQIATIRDGRQYVGNRNKRFNISKSSLLAKSSHKWIVSGELIETSQTFCSTAGKIKPEWVISMASHLVKREVFDPHWSKTKQVVQAYEKVRLYGLVIIEKALVNFSEYDSRIAREVFIKDGLVQGAVKTRAKFYSHNQKLLSSLEEEEAKLRRPEIIINENEIASFYDEHLPASVKSTKELEVWFNKASDDERNSLYMSRKKLMASYSAQISTDSHPDTLKVNRNELTISYVFNPELANDGATVDIPLALVNQVRQKDIDWAVPGIIREKCVALLKGLPKKTRKQLIPINAFVDEIIPDMSIYNGDLLDNLCWQLNSRKKISIRRAEFTQVNLPSHLVVKIRVVNNAKKELYLGESLDSYLEEAADFMIGKLDRGVSSEEKHPIERSGIVDWNFDDIPKKLEIGGDVVLVRYPGLVDKGSSVSIELFDNPHEANRKHTHGILRLYMLKSIQQRNLLTKRFNKFLKDQNLLVPGPHSEFAENAIYASYKNAFNLPSSLPRTKAEYSELLATGKSGLYSSGEDLVTVLAVIFRLRMDISGVLRSLDQVQYLKKDIQSHLANLVDEHFLIDVSLDRIKQFPRYLNAIKVRLSRFPHLGKNDLKYTSELNIYWDRYKTLTEEEGLKNHKDLQVIRWMIEEYRVSLFAQSLGTNMSVSSKRLERQFALLTS